MNRNATQLIIGISVILAGFAAIFGLSSALENSRPPLPENHLDEDLALQGSKLKGFAFGLEGLVADWYWMRSLQYIGGKLVSNQTAQVSLDDLKALNPRLLYPLLDNATTLDPHFTAAYSYGAIVLPAINPDEAIKIAEKGIANNPEEWQLYHQLGYIYWRLKNYEKAAEIYEKGSQINNAPPFMQLMVVRMRTEGESRETSRAIYRQMYQEAQDNQTRDLAQIRLSQLDSLEERDAIRAALQSFKQKNNRCANNWSEIFPLLKSVKLPNAREFRINSTNEIVDPSDAPYLLNKETCDVSLDESKTKIPSDLK